jgi:hypothetical protein
LGCGPGYGDILFDEPAGRLVLLGSGDCWVSDNFLDTVETIELVR